MSPALSIVAALALAHQCAPAVAPETLVSVAKTESGLRPLALQDNTADRSYAPASVNEAVAVATSLIEQQHHNVDLGLMQINSANLASFGLSIPDAFNACRSIGIGARILSGAFHRALRAALSTYNTGDPQRGIDSGYVARVEAAATAIPAITPGLPAAAALASAAQAGGRPTTGWDVFAQSGGTPFVFTSNGTMTHAR